MVLNTVTATETVWLIKDVEKGGRGYGGGGEGDYNLYTYRYTVTTRMTCIKMGSKMRASLMFQ